MNLNAVIDGGEHVLPMDDLPLEMTILSVRNLVCKGNCVTFCDGGYIKNDKTGHKMRFVGRQGVYFIKVQLKAPSPGNALEGFKPMSGLSRPGR